MFKMYSFLGRLGFFRHEGLTGHYPNWWPEARVYYPDIDLLSRRMCIGNAWYLARRFFGIVVPANFKVKR